MTEIISKKCRECRKLCCAPCTHHCHIELLEKIEIDLLDGYNGKDKVVITNGDYISLILKLNEIIGTINKVVKNL